MDGYSGNKRMRRALDARLEAWAQAPAGKPLIVRGARRVGKTNAVEAAGKGAFPDSFVKLDFQTDLEAVSRLFEGPTDDVDRIVANISDYKRRPLSKESTFLMFDEVQLCERALNSLRFFSGSGWKVIATGSQLGVDTRSRSLPFPSGVEQLTMHPMTFEEFLWAVGEDAMAAAIRRHAESLEPYAAHDRAFSYFRLYQVIGGMPAVVAAWARSGAVDDARIEQREIDETYTADMTDPRTGISGVSARKVWQSVPAQLLRSSTKKFKYSEVERGGRRAKLMEPLEWLSAAGVVAINELTNCVEAPLVPYDDSEGSFFKVYLADTGLMFYKLKVNPALWLEASAEDFPISSDFRGALAENGVMQAFSANDLQTYYWQPPSSWGARGELDFLLQDDRMRLVPVEVKSARNLRAKTLASFVKNARSPYAVLLSEENFGRGLVGDCPIRKLPLYAAYCLDEGFVRR